MACSRIGGRSSGDAGERGSSRRQPDSRSSDGGRRRYTPDTGNCREENQSAMEGDGATLQIQETTERKTSQR